MCWFVLVCFKSLQCARDYVKSFRANDMSVFLFDFHFLNTSINWSIFAYCTWIYTCEFVIFYASWEIEITFNMFSSGHDLGGSSSFIVFKLNLAYQTLLCSHNVICDFHASCAYPRELHPPSVWSTCSTSVLFVLWLNHWCKPSCLQISFYTYSLFGLFHLT